MTFINKSNMGISDVTILSLGLKRLCLVSGTSVVTMVNFPQTTAVPQLWTPEETQRRTSQSPALSEELN